MPSQIPQLAADLRQAGLELDPASLADLGGQPFGAIVSLGGCSASFVSPDGLVVTNHHCVEGYLQYNSNAQRDLITDGFLAATLGDEIPAGPSARVSVITGYEDVTERVLGGLSPTRSDLQRQREIERREKGLVQECEASGEVHCRIAGFFGGGRYLRQTALELRDVRLVYAPASSVGNFGGEIDNWMWPRHAGDFGFLRAYVGPDGKPADYAPENVPFHPQHWLPIAQGDLDPGDFVMIAGYPGRTFRYRTAAQVAASASYALPISIRYRQALMTILERQGEGDREVAIKNQSRIRGLANYLKKYEGTVEAFAKADLVGHRRAEEAQMAKAAAANPATARRHATLMDELRRARPPRGGDA